MPFVYDEENIEWPEDAEDDFELPPPTPEQFEYIAPPDFGGAREPVTFSDAPPGSRAAKKSAQTPKPPWKARLMMWLLSKILPGAADFTKDLERQKNEAAERRAKLFSLMVPALREIGGQRVHGIYDGGNDEGFAWFGSLETAAGRLSLDEVVAALLPTGLVPRLKESELIREHPDYPREDADQLKKIVEMTLPEEWAVLLLGWGFGTGPFTMYGSFTVDLHQLTIRDDRDASVPEDGNVLIGGRDE